MASSPVGRKQVESKTESWQEILYKNDSAIIAYKEKRLRRRASVEVLLGQDLEPAVLFLCVCGGGLETVSNAISITLYHRNCAAVFAVTPHRAVTVDTRGAGDPKFRDLCTVCPMVDKRA